MKNIVSIQAPRNFSFVNRLPARFQILILEKANTTQKGTWYRIKISGQEMTLLSQKELKIGKRYIIEKKSNLELKIIDEASLKSKTSVKEVTSHEKKQQLQTQVLHKENFENSSFLLDFSQQNLALFWSHVLSLFALSQKSEINFQIDNEKNFYFKTDWQSQSISGVFKKNKEKWLLYLALPKIILKDNKEKIQSELNEFMFGLPIEKIILTSPEMIHQFSDKIDIFS